MFFQEINYGQDDGRDSQPDGRDMRVVTVMMHGLVIDQIKPEHIKIRQNSSQ